MRTLKFSILTLFVLANVANAVSQEEQYLENKRRQLEIQTRQAKEAKQALEAYKSSFDALQRQKMQALIQKEADINATLARIEATKAENERIMQMTRDSLEAIDKKKDDKVKEIYSQMKDSAIAGVLNEMPAEQASEVIMSLESRKISSVLAKMEPAKASELTLLIKKAENNATLNGGALNSDAGTAGNSAAGAGNATAGGAGNSGAGTAANAITPLNNPNNTASSQDNAGN